MMPERFWNKVDRRQTKISSPFVESPCWLWIAGTRNGYGAYRLNKVDDYAHRWIYRDAIGEIPAGLFVLHRCDNRLCVRPSHLFLGTPKDNVHDMRKKKRDSRGIEHRLAYSNNGKHGKKPSKYVGVSWGGNNWRAHIRLNGKQTALGSFKTEEEARAAYLAAIPDTGFEVQIETEQYQ